MSPPVLAAVLSQFVFICVRIAFLRTHSSMIISTVCAMLSSVTSGGAEFGGTEQVCFS